MDPGDFYGIEHAMFFFCVFSCPVFVQNYVVNLFVFAFLKTLDDFRKSSRKWRSTRRCLLGWPRWNWMYRIQRNYSIWLTVWNESWPWNHRSLMSLEINNISGCNNPVPRCNPWKESIGSVLKTHCAKGIQRGHFFLCMFLHFGTEFRHVDSCANVLKNKSLDSDETEFIHG